MTFKTPCISSPSAPSPPSLAPGYPSVPPASSLPHDSLWVLQWNAGGLQARSTELLHFLSSHPVDLICIQESNLNSPSSFRIPGFSALHSDRTNSRSGILSRDATHASGSVVAFVRQGLSFSKLFTSCLSLLDPYSDYVGINISHNKSPHSLFLMCMPPYSLFLSSWQNRFLFSLHPSSSRNLFILGDFNCHHPLWDSRDTSDPCGEEIFDWVIFSDLLPLNDPDTPFSITPLAAAPLLTFPLLPPLLPFLTPGRCFRTWVLTIYQFFYLSSLFGLSPQRASPFLQLSESSLGRLCLLL